MTASGGVAGVSDVFWTASRGVAEVSDVLQGVVVQRNWIVPVVTEVWSRCLR